MYSEITETQRHSPEKGGRNKTQKADDKKILDATIFSKGYVGCFGNLISMNSKAN